MKNRKSYSFKEIDIVKYVYFNYLSKKIIRKGKGKLIPYRHALIDIEKGSKIILHNGDFHINYHKVKKSKTEAYVKLLKGAVLEIQETVFLNYRATIEIHKNAKIYIGSAYINTGAVLLAAQSIRLGMDNLISRGVHIFDADHHAIIDETGKQKNNPRPVVLEDHVWVGLNCIILRGSWIKEGAVIAAGSVVGGKIKPKTMALGNPARSYSKIQWK